METNETWTPTHDLALIYVALAYGTDHDLSENELDTITKAITEWVPDDSNLPVQEVVMEAATIFLEGDSRKELRRSIEHLSDAFTDAERRQALLDVMRIAEADGVLLEREQGLISTLAEAWSLKRLSKELLEETGAVVQEKGEDWGLIHELAFVYVVVAHASDNNLDSAEIDVILERLQEWQPELTEEDARDMVRSALQVYSAGSEDDLISSAIATLKSALPDVQRLAVLDDLHCIARADGELNDHERDLITSLARAWDVNVRLNGRC